MLYVTPTVKFVTVPELTYCHLCQVPKDHDLEMSFSIRDEKWIDEMLSINKSARHPSSVLFAAIHCHYFCISLYFIVNVSVYHCIS